MGFAEGDENKRSLRSPALYPIELRAQEFQLKFTVILESVNSFL